MTSLARRLLAAVSWPLRRRPFEASRVRGSSARPYDKLLQLLEAFNRGDGRPPPEVLALGDSVSERVARDDDDVRPLWRMLADELSPLGTCAVSHSAYNPDVYRELCRVLTRTRNRPRLIVVTINLRSFLPHWALNPAYQFEDERRAITQWLANPQAPVAAVNDPPLVSGRAEAEFYERRVACLGSELRRMGDFLDRIGTKPRTPAEEAERRRVIFSFFYMHELAASHPRVQALRDTMALGGDLGAEVVAYLTPVNLEGGARHCGPAFREVVERNVATLTKAVDPQRLLDVSGSLTAERFFHRDDPTEHLNQSGRAELAALLARHIRGRLGAGAQ